MTQPLTRTEDDLLGERDIPADVYWGVHTARALDNFPISGTPISRYPELVVALATVKEAAACANRDLGVLPEPKADAIINACRAIRSAALHDQFAVDGVQGGAVTSTNMNANEVIANIALENLGHRRGDYHLLHPVEDVNCAQSTNDVYRTAVKLAIRQVIGLLIRDLAHLRRTFESKALDFSGAVKVGRTQLQQAVPMTLGHEFRAFAVTLSEDEHRLEESRALLRDINLGRTAIGTSGAAHAEYPALVIQHLRRLSGVDVVVSLDLIEATADGGVFVHSSSALKRVAVKLSEICNDLRLLSSGPRAGFDEINLPALQAKPGCVRSHRQPPHRDARRGGWAVAAECLRTRHRPLDPRKRGSLEGGVQRVGRPLR